MDTHLTALVMLGTFTRPSWLAGAGVIPLEGRWSVTTKALDICCWARNLIALCSAVSASDVSAFLINADYLKKITKGNYNFCQNNLQNNEMLNANKYGILQTEPNDPIWFSNQSAS